MYFYLLHYNYFFHLIFTGLTWYLSNFLDFECETGYTKKTGTLELGDKESLIGEGSVPGKFTAIECKSKCDMTSNCKSYHYSPKKQRCKLQKVALPRITNMDYEDFSWCSKSKYFDIFSIIILISTR